MLTFIGLGLFDEYDVSVRGLDAIRNADTVFLEVYTSVLMGSSIERLEEYYGKKITPLYREDVEIHSDKIINAAKELSEEEQTSEGTGNVTNEEVVSGEG